MFRERRNPHDLFCSDVLLVSDLHADEGGGSMNKQELNEYQDYLAERYLETDNVFAEELIIEEMQRTNKLLKEKSGSDE